MVKWFVVTVQRLWTVNSAIANDFNRRYGLNLSERNILITPGSQSLYIFMLLMPLAATPAVTAGKSSHPSAQINGLRRQPVPKH